METITILIWTLFVLLVLIVASITLLICKNRRRGLAGDIIPEKALQSPPPQIQQHMFSIETDISAI
jgi:hypothetical protein